MSVLETLEICFQANLSHVDAQLDRLGSLMAEVSDSCGAAAAGRRVSDEFASGLDSGASAALQSARRVALAADFSAGTDRARNAGRQLSSGFAAGIRDRSGAVQSAVSSVVNAAIRKMRTLLDIHSPSRVTEGFGAYFGEGFIQGISATVAGAERAAGDLSQAAASALGNVEIPEAETSGTALDRAAQSAVERALGGVNLTVPLSVDGMKLGEAAIRGINAVTKSTGRMLLDI